MSYQPVVCQYDGTGCGHILQAGDSEEIGFLASPRSSNEDVFALVRLARAAFPAAVPVAEGSGGSGA